MATKKKSAAKKTKKGGAKKPGYATTSDGQRKRKLTTEQVAAIRERLEAHAAAPAAHPRGFKRRLASEFGISVQHLRMIGLGQARKASSNA